MSSAPSPIPGVDLDFRPEGYWAHTDALGALTQNVKGQNRREMIENVARGESDIATGALDDTLLEDSLPENARSSLGAIHPSFMGGEYLPDYMPGEVEIARVVLASVTQDVYSLRAQRGRTGRIRFRMVDEYESGFRLRPATATQPLSLQELVSMLDSVAGDFDGGHTLFEGIMLNQLESDSVSDACDMAAFITVQSVVYPQLERYYDHRLLEDASVLMAHHRGTEEDDAEDDEPHDTGT